MDVFIILMIILIIVIFSIVIFKRPCAEFFQDAVDTLLKKSSILYSNTDDEKSYYESLNPFNNDLLIMNRCIEFKKEGIEKVIQVLKTQNRFFISEKYTATYSDFTTIEETIKKNMLTLYDSSKRIFHGPIYLLITQYPIYTTTYQDMGQCMTINLSVPIENNFSPINREMVEECVEPQRLIECEYYILMPAHKSFNNGVGEYFYKTWSEIKKNMEILLVGGNNNVLNVRSKDQQCFIKCGNIQTDGYMCAARNSVNDKPYKSIVANSPTNNKQQKINVDYANLYVINTNGINILLGMTITPIIEKGVNIELINLPVSNIRDVTLDNDGSNIDDLQSSDFLNIDRAEYERLQQERKLQNERLELERALQEMSDEQASCYLMRYPDLRNAFGNDIMRGKTHWVDSGIREGRTKVCTDALLNMVRGTTNGLTRERAAPSAKHIVDVYKTINNGIYWIDLPTIGPTQVFCIMNPACDGGGWMLAMKGSNGNVFNYNSSYWSNSNTLNPTNPSRDNGNAKYEVFNHYKATDWFAGFPDVQHHTGDINRDVYNGFTWLEKNAVGSEKTLLEFFRSNVRLTKSRNPRDLRKFNGNVWSSQNGFQWYGMNYQGGHGHKSRWGFGWNNERDERTNDATGGIGTQHSSAGDHFGCCGNRGLNRTMRFEFYVR